ncbi:MAG TPA: glycosyltransferase, partial [Longimicrobium sp.]|nr:glycosyltransferase [Longimicrobium sp.]
MSRPWHFIVGEYPPQPGGVADYAAQVARGLAKQGAGVHVWAPPSRRGEGGEPGVHVHRLPDRFGPRGLRALGEGLSRLPEGRLFVHYVPQSFGLRGMNLALPLWLAARREDVWVMFHEVSVEWSREQLAANVLAAATQTMAAVMVRRADRLFVSIPAWSDRLPLRLLRRGVPPPVWLPIPSNLPMPAPAPTRAPPAT